MGDAARACQIAPRCCRCALAEIFHIDAVRDTVLPFLEAELWLPVFWVCRAFRSALSLQHLVAQCTDLGLLRASRAMTPSMCGLTTSGRKGEPEVILGAASAEFHLMWPSLASHLCARVHSRATALTHPTFVREQFVEATIASTRLEAHRSSLLETAHGGAWDRVVMCHVRALSGMPSKRMMRQVAHSSDLVRLVKYGSDSMQDFMRATLGLVACSQANLIKLRAEIVRCGYPVNVHPLYERVSRRGDCVVANSTAFLACEDCGAATWVAVDTFLCYTCRSCGRLQSCLKYCDGYETRPTLRDAYSFAGAVCCVIHGRRPPALVRATFCIGGAFRVSHHHDPSQLDKVRASFLCS